MGKRKLEILNDFFFKIIIGGTDVLKIFNSNSVENQEKYWKMKASKNALFFNEIGWNRLQINPKKETYQNKLMLPI